MSQLDTADRQEPTEALAAKVSRPKEKLTKLKDEMGKLAVYEKQMRASPDQQISLTDSDGRSMATSGRGSGVVGYNVQVAVDTEHRRRPSPRRRDAPSTTIRSSIKRYHQADERRLACHRQGALGSRDYGGAVRTRPSN
ncbi:hypothetical protein ABIC01_009254 [Bradyrhizobium sp. RT4b]